MEGDSMRLKCVGGPNDGEIFKVRNDIKYGEAIQIPTKQEFKILDHIPSYEESMKAMTTTIEIYIYEILKYSYDGKKEELPIIFLRYHKLKLWEAVEHQFTK